MDRVQRVARLWNWLPVFRAVAETEHVHAAAKRLRLSPSALSRTIRLLEEDVGEALFRRIGRTIELTDAGREMLLATREAMRRMDDGLDRVCGTKWSGPVRVSSEGRLSSIHLLPALRRLRTQYPKIVPHLVSAGGPELIPKLLCGQLDMAVTYQSMSHEDVVTVVLGHATHGAYCGVGHPLYAAKTVTVDMVIAHPFAAPEARLGMSSADNWPAELPRRIGLYSAIMDGGIEPCAHGELLAVFPDRIVPTFACASRLRRLPIEMIDAQAIYAVRRRPVSAAPGPVDMLISDLQTDVAQAA